MVSPMAHRAVQKAFMRLHEVCERPVTEMSTAATSENDDKGASSSPSEPRQDKALAEVTRGPSTDKMDVAAGEPSPDASMQTKQDVDWRSRGRLNEMEQQLEMAESRCSTLKQQLDYMRVLYRGVDRSRVLIPDLQSEFEPTPETPPVKVKKERRAHRRRPATETGGVEGVTSLQLTTKRHEKSPRAKYDTVSLSAVSTARQKSSARESARSDLSKLGSSRSKEEAVVVGDLIDLSDVATPAEGDGKEAAKAIQDILTGMTNSVNQMTPEQLELQPLDKPEKQPRRRHHHRNQHHSSHDVLVALNMDADENLVTREDAEPTEDDIYHKNFQRVYANDTLIRKSTKTGHSPRKDHPYGLATVGQDVESDESGGRVERRKPRSKKPDKTKSKASPVSHANVHTSAAKVNDEPSALNAKSKKKKLNKIRPSNSRSTLKSTKHRKTCEVTERIPAYSSEQTAYDNCWPGTNLVELYHNNAIRTDVSVSEEHIKVLNNGSDVLSSSSYLKKTQEEHNMSGRISVARPDTGSCKLRADVDNSQWPQRCGSARLNRCEASESVITVNRESSKVSHFELPTVASSMRQVDRSSNLNRFNFRNIPFVVGKSTSPTHNLGLNIQQVLSMIKMRQPVSGISPMVLAGGLIRESQLPGSVRKPLTNYLERMSSRPMTRRSMVDCPPTIPERDELEDLPQHDDDDEGYMDFKCHRGTYSAVRPATSCELGLRKETKANDEFETYRADWGKRASETTAFPNKKYNNYHEVLNQYLDGEQLSFLKTRPTKVVSATHHRRLTRSRSMRSGDREAFNKTLRHQMSGMKEVMQKLHDDFIQLSQDYDDLCATVERDDSGTLVHEDDQESLRQMAADVQNKENEIKLVMELLEEVSILHKMVASLNQKTSMASMTGRVVPSHSAANPKPRRIVPREPTTAVRLTRLLRTIQSFQEKLKQET